jgi:putative effector of murein hydrolase
VSREWKIFVAGVLWGVNVGMLAAVFIAKWLGVVP